MVVKGIIFDFWGTLVENGIFPSPIKQVKYLVAKNVLFKDFVVKFEEVMLTKKYSDLNEAFKAVCEEFGTEPKEELLERLVGMWNKNELLGKPFLETIEVLDYLKEKGLKLALVANTTQTINMVLDKFDLKENFDVITLSYEEGLLKSDTKFMEKTLKKMSLKKEEVVMIGDSIPSDIISARNAEVKSILLDRKNQREFSPKIFNLRQIKELIESEKLEKFAQV
jgi:HAD superfamily hydrolase (TIGR01549 family)